MSPEQINGSKDIDLRTDIYAMGVITYEMFAGKTPFLGDTLQAIMTGHLFTEPPRLDDVPANLGVPKPIAEIIDRMLVKDPADRYGSAIEVLDDHRAIDRKEQPVTADTLNKGSARRVAPASRAGSRARARTSRCASRRWRPRARPLDRARTPRSSPPACSRSSSSTTRTPHRRRRRRRPRPPRRSRPRPSSPTSHRRPSRSTTTRSARPRRPRCGRRSRRPSPPSACSAATRSARSRTSRACPRSPS